MTKLSEIYPTLKDIIRNKKVIEIRLYGTCPDTNRLRVMFVTSYKFYNPIVVTTDLRVVDSPFAVCSIRQVTSSAEYSSLVLPKEWPKEPEKIYSKEQFDRLFSLE